MNVNVWDVVEPIRALIAERAAVDADRLADPAVGLEDVRAGAGAAPIPNKPTRA